MWILTKFLTKIKPEWTSFYVENYTMLDRDREFIGTFANDHILITKNKQVSFNVTENWNNSLHGNNEYIGMVIFTFLFEHVIFKFDENHWCFILRLYPRTIC